MNSSLNDDIVAAWPQVGLHAICRFDDEAVKPTDDRVYLLTDVMANDPRSSRRQHAMNYRVSFKNSLIPESSTQMHIHVQLHMIIDAFTRQNFKRRVQRENQIVFDKFSWNMRFYVQGRVGYVMIQVVSMSNDNSRPPRSLQPKPIRIETSMGACRSLCSIFFTTRRRY